MNYNTYKSIDTLPQWNFIRARENDDLKYLIKSDEYDFNFDVDGNINRIWESINNEYIQATSHRFENKQFADIHRQIFQLQVKYNAIRGYAFVLMIDIENKDAIDGLMNLGYRVKTHEDVKSIVHRAKNIKTQIREKQNELIKLQSNNIDQSFEEIVFLISNHYGYYIDPKKRTVREWIPIEDNYIKSIQKNASNRQKEDIRR